MVKPLCIFTHVQLDILVQEDSSSLMITLEPDLIHVPLMRNIPQTVHNVPAIIRKEYQISSGGPMPSYR